MFKPKTGKIEKLAKNRLKLIQEIESFFEGKTSVYIDFANVLYWQDKLGWHIDLKRLKQFLESFNTVHSIKFYNGTLYGDNKSETFMNEVQKYEDEIFKVKTKPVKIMKLSIDVSSISKNSPALLESFISKSLLSKFDLETIEYLNSKLEELNKRGIKYIEDRKCNFDVEIGRDIFHDYENGEENFILWSSDSDFESPVRQLLKEKKKVILFATARKVSRELGDLTKEGLFIFDIQKIRNFICWNRETQKGSPKETPKLQN